MNQVWRRLSSELRARVRAGAAYIKLRLCPDGDYCLPYSFLHRSLQPHLSADYEDCASSLGKDVAHKWSRDGCGIASGTIAIEAAARRTAPITLPPVTELCEMYRDRAYIPGIGWTHGGLVQFARDFGIEAFNEPRERPEAICTRMSANWIPIVSVTLYFKGGEEVTGADGETVRRGKGGHLVVLTGYRISKGKLKGFFIDDCQDLSLRDGETSKGFVDIGSFNGSFSGKVIYIRG
jgi:hypothetical protein